MHPAISCELATARIADLHRRAQREALARAVPVRRVWREAVIAAAATAVESYAAAAHALGSR